MTTTPSSTKPFLAALSRLRLSVSSYGRPAADQVQQNMLYAQAFVRGSYDPVDVDSACIEWAATHTAWPEQADLLKLVREHEQLRRVARTPRLPPPSPERLAQHDLTDEQRLAMWARNDELAATMRANRRSHFCADALLALFDGMRARRFAEHPELAARYHRPEETAA